ALISIDPATGNQKTISMPPSANITKASWLPNGKAMAVIFSAAETNFARQQIGLISYPDGKFRPITADANDYATLSVSSDGATIAPVRRASGRDVCGSSGQRH